MLVLELLTKVTEVVLLEHSFQHLAVSTGLIKSILLK